MKSLTFFNEKGGTGKSTFTMMYASWLQYIHGVRVTVVDFNERLEKYRNDEIEARKNYDREMKAKYDNDMAAYEQYLLEKKQGIEPEMPKNAFQKRKPSEPEYLMDKIRRVTPYRIISEDIQYIEDKIRSKQATTAYSKWVQSLCLNGTFEDTDVLIFDFAGSIDDGKYLDLFSRGMIGMTVIPVDNDKQAEYGAERITNVLTKYSNNFYSFINKVQPSQAKKDSSIIDLAKGYIERGLILLPDIVAYSAKMDKRGDEVDMLRSTLEYPEWEKGFHKKDKDLGFHNLFFDISCLLNNTKDVLETEKTELEFLSNIGKVNDPKRQLKGTPLPDYEMSNAFYEL